MKQFPELKIKIASLSEEARIIRAEEKKHIGERHNAIHNHRVVDVRRAQRATLVAYGYLRGKAYRQIEPKTRWDVAPYDRPGPDWNKVENMCVTYGPYEASQKAELRAKITRWRLEPPPQSKAA